MPLVTNQPPMASPVMTAKLSFESQPQHELVAEAMADLTHAGLAGDLAFDETTRRLFATDASEYQELPVGVVWPDTHDDVRKIVSWASRHQVSLIPRTAGTSLAGQCVGAGLVMDFSRHFRRILNIDPVNRRVTVQPGVIRNELNAALATHGLLFGPETSTANRAMIGGMVGNNSCGSNSIIYGSTRDQLVRLRGVLSDGSEVVFGPLSAEEFHEKCAGATREAEIYRAIRDLLQDAGNRAEITREYPLASIPRRNTGYALDLLMQCSVFDPGSSEPFNFCRLIAGSEGTLFVTTEIELQCNPLPPPHQALLVGHFSSLEQSLRANLVALGFQPSACELIDKHILDCSRENLDLARKRDFLVGDPAAILVIEFRRDTETALQETLLALESALRNADLGYAFPTLRGSDSSKVWDLRRAGQAVINNVTGHNKPREVAEDTAVDVQSLPDYIRDFEALMKKHGIDCVYYGHAATGELHMRPIFSLHSAEGVRMFRAVAQDVATLVKSYRGSLSGEHGDGRLRGEFLRQMIGERCYDMVGVVKRTFDPLNILNPGKIFEAPPMDESLRHTPGTPPPAWNTVFDWKGDGGMTAAAEKCNGAGECVRTHLSGGTMCPSYMATRREEDSTRGRANLLRQLMTERGKTALHSDELHRVLDLCLGCKGCKSECPSNVDLARLKAEFLEAYHDRHGIPLRSRIIANFDAINRLARLAPWAWNAIFGTPILRKAANRLAGFHPHRSIPLLPRETLRSWFSHHQADAAAGQRGEVYLFADEFTNFLDSAIGIKTVQLLERLGYRVTIPDHVESGRSSLSKGLLKKARHLARQNVRRLHPLITDRKPLIGIEPSAFLGFRDEYPDLLRGDEQRQARELASHCLMLDEFLLREFSTGRLTNDVFRECSRVIRLHGHCHQKALTGISPTVRALELVPGHDVRLIASGCCGMAGSFGYEAEHYALSQEIGELVLLPTVRQEPKTSAICAPGTSCRHQIHDATGRRAQHPAEILWEALG